MAREAISARMDGEATQVPTVRIDEHLATCADCQAWLDRSGLASDALGALGTRPAPDLAQSVVGSIGAPTSRPGRGRGKRSARLLTLARRHVVALALTLCGLAQIGVAMTQMAGHEFGMGDAGAQKHSDGVTHSHILNETNAWAMALGVAMVIGAWWAGVRAGLLAVLSVFVVILVGYVISDLAAGDVTAARVASHLPVLAGVLVTAVGVWRPSEVTPSRRT